MDSSGDYGIGSWPARRARISGNRPALRQGDRVVGYAELAAGTERLALALRRLGADHGARVAYLGPNDIAMFEALFATARSGAVFVPLNYRLTAAELGRLLDDAGPVVLLAAPGLRELAEAGLAEAGLAEAGLACAGLARAGVAGGPVAVAEASAAGYAGLAADADWSQRPVTALHDDAILLYTSGTTGEPKGVRLTHGNVTFNTMNQLAHADVLSTDQALCMAPLYHAAGLGQVSLPTLFKGGTVHVMSRFDPATVLGDIARLRITSFSAVPTMMQYLCDHPDFATTDLSSLRYVIFGGSPIAGRVAAAWSRRGVEILHGYGMTEASPGVYLAPPGLGPDHLLSMGVPHFFTDVAVAPEPGAAQKGAAQNEAAQNEAAEHGGVAEAAPGAAGELLVGGLNVAAGYWNRPEATARAFAGSWYRSGDLVRVDDDGLGYVAGRRSDMFISGGENVHPNEVEAAIKALPGVTECAVIPVPDARWGEAGHAYVVAEPGVWSADSLLNALRETLAGFKIPRGVTFAPDLPRTPSGKVRKQDLPRL
jgi:fatty-acyl-CoA synthase